MQWLPLLPTTGGLIHKKTFFIAAGTGNYSSNKKKGAPIPVVPLSPKKQETPYKLTLLNGQLIKRP